MEHKENTGTLFKNQYKTEDKHPNYKGRINAMGKMMDIALWKRTGKQGEPYLSVMISEPRQKQEQPRQIDKEWDAIKVPEEDLPNDFVPF
jgi:uncharacterized protein (DUF736 family)